MSPGATALTRMHPAYRPSLPDIGGRHAGTAMIGLYSRESLSHSPFHLLPHDEVWHFYGGDALRLVLLHPDVSSEEIILRPHRDSCTSSTTALNAPGSSAAKSRSDTPT